MRRDSITGVLFELSLPTLDTVVHNSRSRIIFAAQVTMSNNNIVQWFYSVLWQACVILLLLFISVIIYGLVSLYVCIIIVP